MPQDIPFSSKPAKSKRISIPRVRSSTDSDIQPLNFLRDFESETVLPIRIRNRLYELFNQIEKEFELLYCENVSLHEKIDALNERLDKECCPSNLDNRVSDTVEGESGKSVKKASQTTHLIKTTHKLKAQTSKIVSSFKAPTLGSHLVREYSGHHDGVWEVSVSRAGQHIIGTSSADHTARIWSVETGKCLQEYVGHHGSVNSIRFHPTQDFVITASGDQSAHIWCFISALDSTKGHSSEDEVELSEKEDAHDDETIGETLKIHSPLYELVGHTGVVIAADWIATGDHVITASWDRCSTLFDARTGQVLHSVVGHEQGLNNVVAHPSQRLVVTCSKDSTFRIWDLRETSQTALVCHGHADSVTTAIFTANDKVVSASDDRCVKVWDMKNLRSPLATIRSDSSANRLSVSNQQVLAIPLDNRHVRLYDINGNRLARLPRGSRQGHRRMVCATAWLDDPPQSIKTNLFTCGFDRLVLGWQVQPLSKEGKDSKD